MTTESMSSAFAGASDAPLLAVAGLDAWYGESHVLHEVGFTVRPGEVVSMLGRNGAGKTTTIKSIIGVLRKRSGSIVVGGRETIKLKAPDIARLGVGFVPEERGIFGSLSVRENLMLPPVLLPGGLEVDEILQLFPNIGERMASRGKQLSGGEQQMLAIARILRTGAQLLLLDEPTEGLAPVIIDQIGRTLMRLKQRHFTMVLVEQNFRFASKIADRHIIIEEGRVVDEIPNGEMAASRSKIEAYLGI